MAPRRNPPAGKIWADAVGAVFVELVESVESDEPVEIDNTNCKLAVGSILVDSSAEMIKRYGSALDLLAQKVGPHLWDCNGGVWERPGGDKTRHRLSLAHLSRLIVDECEQARKTREAAPKPKPTAAKRGRLTSAERRTLVKEIRAVASSLRTGGIETHKAILDGGLRYVVPSDKPPEPSEPMPKGLTSAQWTLWLQGRRPWMSFIAALEAVANELDGRDNRAKPLGRNVNVETVLAAEIVTWLRVATGAPGSYQRGDRIPIGGRPFYEVAAAFLQAAGYSLMTAAIIKARLEARNGA